MVYFIEERVLSEGKYIASTKATVRATAKYFGVSKSTVHKDMTERLKELDCDLAEEVKKVLCYNLSQRHLRGGLATKAKYERERKGEEC